MAESEMVLKVAQAMWARRVKWAAENGVDLSVDPADEMIAANGVLGEARAAIEELRKPTKAMAAAGFDASPHDVAGCRDQIDADDEWMAAAVLAPYAAMIDAALQEDTQ